MIRRLLILLLAAAAAGMLVLRAQSPAAVDFRAIADDMGRWTWRTPARPAVFPQALAA